MTSDATVTAMRDLAQAVLRGQPKSHVEAARVLARFILDSFPAPSAREDIALGAIDVGDLKPPV